MAKIKLGDVIRMPIGDDRYAYARYIWFEKQFLGHLIEVSAVVSKTPREASEIGDFSIRLFPPVFVWIDEGLKYLDWKIIGNIPIVNFTHPIFAKGSDLPGHEGPRRSILFLYQGEEHRHVTTADENMLPDLENLMVSSADLFINKIVLGHCEDYAKDHETPHHDFILID